VTHASVNDELLEAFAVPPERGRWFRREETRLGGPRVVILSNELWRSAFAAREDIVGHVIDVNGANYEVVGIMPAGFDLLDRRVELWLPLQLDPAARQYRSSHFLSVVGRLKPDVSREQADAELASLVASWGVRTGASGHLFTPGEHVIQMEPVLDEIVGSARRPFWMLQAVAGMVLLIASLNLANLLMVRAEVRRREVAVRTAIGAGRWRLTAQFITEGLVLSALGGAGGLVLGWLGVRVLTNAYPESVPRVADIAIDPTVLGITLLVSVVTGLVFGLAPLSHLPKSISGSLLNDRSVGATPARPSMRSALVAGEVAVAVVLVVGAGLMVRTVLNLMTVDAGFERSRLVTFAVALPAATYPKFDQRAEVYRRLLDRLRVIPGLTDVAAVSGLPPRRGHNGFGTDIDDHLPPGDVADLVDYYQTVTTGSFDAMRIPIVRGRAFEVADRTAAPVAIVNETFVRTFWKDLEPIGRRVKPRFGDQTPWVTVVGVARDVKQAGLDQPTGTEVYFLLDQLPRIFPTIPAARLGDWWGDGSMHVMLRSALPAATLQPSIGAAVRAVDPSLPVIRLRNMDDVFRNSVRRPVMLMQLLAAFAGLALVLATIGTYGVLSYMVALCRREIGIRIALGAERATVLRNVMSHGLKLTAVGLIAGLGGALALTRLMETLLFGIRPSDPATLVGVAALITVVAAVASLVPAVRATRVDPIVALRDE
jgi:predicted permease